LESFTDAERVLFMRFVSGRSRLPANLADLSQRFQVKVFIRQSGVFVNSFKDLAFSCGFHFDFFRL
jgi:hypothetical protein